MTEYIWVQFIRPIKDKGDERNAEIAGKSEGVRIKKEVWKILKKILKDAFKELDK